VAVWWLYAGLHLPGSVFIVFADPSAHPSKLLLQFVLCLSCKGALFLHAVLLYAACLCLPQVLFGSFVLGKKQLCLCFSNN
jgi:hypothetical protein